MTIDLHGCIFCHVVQFPGVLVPSHSAGETAALVAHDGVDALLDVAQHLGGRGSSATAGGNSPACARTIWLAKVASRFLRWSRRNRGCAIRSCSSGPPEACERGRPRPPDRGLL